MKPDLADSLRINISRFLINYAVRFSFAAVVVYSCWIAIENYNYWFSWHVILCTFGYVPLMAEALMLFTGDELWSKQISKKAKNKIHAFIIIMSTVIIICGNSVCFHYIQPGYHLYTAHGITGLISMILIIMSIALGYAAHYATDLHEYAAPVVFKFWHNLIGLLGYTIGIASLCFAYYTNWFIYYTTPESRLVALIFTILASLWSINGALISGYSQIKTLIR